MTLDARTRSSIYEKLRPLLGDDDANALMSEFPTTDTDRPVTEQTLRAELAELRAELHTELAELRTELHTELAELRTELHTELGTLRTELHTELGTLRAEMADTTGGLRAEMHDLGRTIVMWNTGSVLAGMGLAATIARLLG
jgi:ribosomal protein L29